jgi:predicted ATPase/class 3 adenylate cyclase
MSLEERLAHASLSADDPVVRPELPTGTVTFLFTDVEGSTRLLHELGGEAYAGALAEHRRVIRAACAAEGGVEVDTQGDAFFFAFPTAPRALAAASAFTDALASGPINVRVGLHTGTPLLADEGYVGTDVHRAARIAAAGHGGQVLVAASTAVLVDAELVDLGEHRLKDLAAPERIYQLGASEFAALKSLYRTNLPIPATSFLGRERELSDVIALLHGTRLLTLTGPGGTGKTRLALQAAADAAEAFPDGMWWIPLAPLREPASIVPAIADAVAVREEPGVALADSIREHLAGKRTLVLLDNAEHLLPEIAPHVATLLEATGPVMLVTSRERLHVAGEQLYPVPTLTHSDGASLFRARARALQPDFSGNGVVTEICSRLENLPLALELAAARVTLFTPDQLLERLGQRLDLLKGDRSVDPRQQTLRATIAWSYDLLEDSERLLLQRLSVFAGGCTYESAEEVAGAEPDAMQSLLDKSLLRRRDAASAPRYWMLETIREFAAERLDASGVAEEIGRGHAQHYAALAEAAELELTGADQQRWWQRLTDEYENMRVALAWACDRREKIIALRLTTSLARYWWTRGHYREGQGWYDNALALEGDVRPLLHAKAIYGLANMAYASGEVAKALPMLEESLATFREEGADVLSVWALTDLGIAHGKEGRLDLERAYFEEALEYSRQSQYARGVGISCINLGCFFLAVDEIERAAALFEEALAYLREAGDHQSTGNVLNNVAYVELRRGSPEAAAARLREGILLLRKTDDRYALAHALVVASAVLVARDEAAGALRTLAGADALKDEMGLALDWVEARLFDDTKTVLRAELGDAAFDEAWEAGRSREYDEILDTTLVLLA